MEEEKALKPIAQSEQDSEESRAAQERLIEVYKRLKAIGMSLLDFILFDNSKLNLHLISSLKVRIRRKRVLPVSWLVWHSRQRCSRSPLRSSRVVGACALPWRALFSSRYTV